MIKIGLTGGIGSGKSVVSQVLQLHGIPVFDADIEAKKLNDTSPSIRKKLTVFFGENLYAEGKLDRRKLAEIIFEDEEKLQFVNSVVHPELAHLFLLWADKQRENGHGAAVIDAAVLFESGFRQYVDIAVSVIAPFEMRIERVMQRDKTNRKAIEARIKNQITDAERVRKSDFIITNDNKASLLAQIDNLLNSHRTTVINS